MELKQITLRLDAAADIMFDRFIDHSGEARPAEQKLYLDQESRLVLPQDNIDAFLFGEDPMGCAKAFEGKRNKEYLRIGKSHVFVNDSVLLFEQKGKPIVVKGQVIDDSRFYIKLAGGRTKQGARSIKQEAKPRPVLRMPWTLTVHLTLAQNSLIDETKLFNWFTMGGIQIGLGTWRPNYGRFFVSINE